MSNSLRRDPMDCRSQAPLSMGFSRQGYWNGLPWIKCKSHVSYIGRQDLDHECHLRSPDEATGALVMIIK